MSSIKILLSENSLPKNIARIAKDYLFRHGRHRLLLMLILWCLNISAQEPNQAVNLSNQDIADTIASLKTDNPGKTVELFRQKMPAAVTDKKRREAILNSQPKQLYDIQIHDYLLEAKVRSLIKPVLALYNRENSYVLIIVKYDIPYVMLDSGVLLVISTAILDQSESDDEILGYIAHEVGHEYYTDYTIFTKHIIRLVKNGGKELALERRLSDVLALLELQCDAFSAITLAHLGYDPTAFVEAMERTAKKYPSVSKMIHPSESIRRQVVIGVIPNSFIKPSKRTGSLLLQDIKSELKPIFKLIN